jgi:hypothetical protein
VPRSIISFGFEDGFVDSFDDGFEGFGGGTTFRGLTDITGRIEGFSLAAETKAGTEAKAGVGTRGTVTEAGVAVAVEIFGTVGVFGIADTVGAGAVTGIALGMEAFSFCARLNKDSI